MSISDEKRRRLLFEMLRIRRLQLRIESEYHLDEMKTPVHLCIGQEAVAVGVSANLEQHDYISSSHRSHGHYLAKGGDLDALVAELFCKETGCSRGRGGSMHLVDTAVGHMGSSSIVGGGIPIGTGLALAAKMRREGRVSVVFFGDGAADEGVLYESINFAMLKDLPVVYVYENNQVSVCSKVESRHAGPVIFHYLPEYRMPCTLVDGNDVLAVHEEARVAVDRARNGGGPSFIECVTYRMRGHAGAGSDAHLGYRTEEEIAAWEKRDPVSMFSRTLHDEGVLDDEQYRAMTARADAEIDRAFRFAVASPLPGEEQLPLYLYSE
ncbi:MAG: thiamine pyrophosphate-dependent dehydrogenase E1 component subunit alpha [Deltaproteobacteria bacterium]|nr:thiamine pyrophosphate-dependent dehydrogenase E1 component subunit alpha [Deltaproteobacteria bacterium]